MKFLIILLTFTSPFTFDWLVTAKCENEGCYEVIKTFAELLAKKINETDAVSKINRLTQFVCPMNTHENQILAEAENKLSEISFGNDESFTRSIKEVDDKLRNLIIEMYTGVDGGGKTLFAMINEVFDDVNKIENLAKAVESEVEGATKNAGVIAKNVDDTQEIIRQLQDEINKVLNATTVEGPEALQDAFDRSEKFNTNSSELKDILEQMKLILKDYEINLRNAKRLTSQAVEKFAQVSQQADKTLDKQKSVGDTLSETVGMKVSEDELKNLKKLTGEALEQANKVFDDAFDLLSEVSEFELRDKLEIINAKVDNLNKHSDAAELDLKTFADENAKFLDDMEKTIEAAEIAEEKAFELLDKIEELLKTVNDIHNNASQAIADKNSIIENAKNIYNSLEDFTLKVEKSRENARTALEKIPEILKKIEDSVKIVEKLEQRMDYHTKTATEAKDQCTTAKEQMDEILGESDNIKAQIKQLETDFETQPDEITKQAKESTRISDEVDKLDERETEDEKLIKSTQEKVENTKTKAQETDVEVDKALQKVQKLMDEIGKFKSIDEDSLDDFGK